MLYKKYAKNAVDVKTFIAKCLELKGGFIFSKNMCLLFLDTFMSGTGVKKKQHWYLNMIIRYASSNTDLSSFFVKSVIVL